MSATILVSTDQISQPIRYAAYWIEWYLGSSPSGTDATRP